MNTKEKAKSLIDRYLKEVFSGEYKATEFSILCAKECALIAVDEILEFIKTMWTHESAETTFWKEVKNEINNL